MTNEGGGGCMRDSPRSPMAKTNGSRFEGNRIINPHSPDSKVNKQTNKQIPIVVGEPMAPLITRAENQNPLTPIVS